MSEGAAGSGSRKGKMCTKPDPAKLTPAHEDTQSYQCILLWALHSLQSVGLHFTEKSQRSWDFCPANCVWVKDKICNQLCEPWTDPPHQIQWAQTTQTVPMTLVRAFVPDLWVSHTPQAAWSLALTSPQFSPLLLEQCQPWPSIYTKSLGNNTRMTFLSYNLIYLLFTAPYLAPSLWNPHHKYSLDLPASLLLL